ncbi:MAG: cysteine hydrolase [Candidatus Thermoplasmatota archaeon]|nr:cysteine hydrolase [Candidatus Thermoplasmatota archaeon]
MKKAWIIVDMVNDFVTGKFGSEAAAVAAKNTGKALSLIGDKLPVVFTLDTHVPADPEFMVWGEHCLIGTSASELDMNVSSYDGYIIRKRRYDSFLDTDLDPYLRMHNITDLYISGVSTDICVAHTVAGAFFRYYIVTVVKDLCASIDPSDHSKALKSMKKYYGTRIINLHQFLAEVL